MLKRKNALVAFILLSTLGLEALANLPVKAALQQRDITGPITLKFHQQLDSAYSHIGDPFRATVTSTSCYQRHCIPAGTTFSGFVMEVKPSRKIHRPGYLDLQVGSIHYPDGRHLAYDSASKRRNIRLMSPEAYTVKRQLLDEVPAVLGATAVVVPLALASSLGPGAIIPLGFAGAIIASGIQEGVQTARGREHGNFLEHTGRTVARGTVVPYVAYKATQLSPEAHVGRGDVVAVRPGSRFARELYRF
jgi:hypothetical protein